MAALKAMESVYYVGVLDKDLRVFDIIMETDQGTTYNAYLLQGSQKTVLFECVKDKFCDELLKNIQEICPPSKIDYVVMNHTEPDHSGCLARVLEAAPNATVVASQTAINFLSEILNAPFRHQAVAEGDTLDIGGMALHFYMTPMLHWPDTMVTHVPEIEALFSCDIFGCHYADELVFNDLMTGDFTPAYKYYFDNIMGPYAVPHIQNMLAKVKPLPIQFIGPGHGPVLRKDIPHYISLYDRWSQPVSPHDKTVAIAYVSAYGYTASLAAAVRRGLTEGGIKRIEMFDLVTDDMDAAKAAISAADGILLGSPTLVGDALPPIYEVLLCLNPVIHRGKFAGAFGAFGWSGEAVHNLTRRLEDLRMNLPLPGIRVRFKPNEEDLKQAEKFGADFAREMLGTA